MCHAAAMRLLLVEDEREFATMLAAGLTAEGYVVDVAHDGRAGFHLARTDVYGVIVLDLMLPTMNGDAVCEQLRREGIATPILILTAKNGEFDQLDALDGGADDYLTKPFSYAILLARLRAMTRRALPLVSEIITVGDVVINSGQRTVTRGTEPIDLSAREFAILELLARAGGAVVSKHDLLLQLWPGESDDTNLVEARVSGLRRKLSREHAHDPVLTVRGSGYRLISDAGSAQ